MIRASQNDEVVHIFVRDLNQPHDTVLPPTRIAIFQKAHDFIRVHCVCVYIYIYMYVDIDYIHIQIHTGIYQKNILHYTTPSLKHKKKTYNNYPTLSHSAKLRSELSHHHRHHPSISCSFQLVHPSSGVLMRTTGWRPGGAGASAGIVRPQDWINFAVSTISTTPLKINMEPKTHPIENKNHLPNLHYCVPC